MNVEDVKKLMKYIESVSKELYPEDPIKNEDYEIHDLGLNYKDEHLMENSSGVYIFIYKGMPLKIGKAGPKTDERFYSQHYSPKSAKSTFAKSLLEDEEFSFLNKENISEWIHSNVNRINIHLKSTDKAKLEFIEFMFHYKFRPKYEGELHEHKRKDKKC